VLFDILKVGFSALANAGNCAALRRDFLRHSSGVRWVIKKKSRASLTAARDRVHHRRTVGLVIPCRVASPQSPTPFHQAPGAYLRGGTLASAVQEGA